MPEAPYQRDSLVVKVDEFIGARCLIPAEARVVVAVSGGADSVALLAVLRELAAGANRKWELVVAHLNHRLRDQAAADADFVADLAKRWSLECVVGSRDVAGQARRLGVGVEEAGRDARYEFLASVAAERGAALVAVGHTADDNIETVLYRLVRGTHIRGLSGIPVARPLGLEGISLVRPLLSCTREEVESFCRRAGLTWRQDASNAETAYRRNFIRNELLPLLRTKLNARADEALTRLAAAAGQVEDYLTGIAARAMSAALVDDESGRTVLAVNALADQHELIRRYVARLALERQHVPEGRISTERIEALGEMLAGGGPRAVSLPGGWVAQRQRDRVTIAPARQDQADQLVETVTLNCPGRTEIAPHCVISCRLIPFDRAGFESHCRNKVQGVELMDADQLCGPLTCRPRRPGDVFQPLGCGGRQSVGDFLTNQKVPRRLRRRTRCITDDLGIVYVAPFRIDERVRVTPRTVKVLQIVASDLASLQAAQ